MIINGIDYDAKIDEAKQRLDDLIYFKEFIHKIDDYAGRDVLIVSDGTAKTTHVYVDGVELKNIISISIDEIQPFSLLKARIEVLMPSLYIRPKGKYVEGSKVLPGH